MLINLRCQLAAPHRQERHQDLPSHNIYCHFLTKMITIYHNPRCSKSCEALAIVEKFAQDNDLAVQIIEYLKTPLTVTALVELQRKLAITPRHMARDNEPEFAELSLADAGDATLFRAVAECPRLLQRPIVEYDGRAVIGRPPELVTGLLTGT